MRYLLLALVAGCTSSTSADQGEREGVFTYEVGLELGTAAEVLVDGSAVEPDVDGVVRIVRVYETHEAALEAPTIHVLATDGESAVGETELAPLSCAWVCDTMDCSAIGLTPVIRESEAVTFYADRVPQFRSYCFRCAGPDGGNWDVCD